MLGSAKGKAGRTRRQLAPRAGFFIFLAFGLSACSLPEKIVSLVDVEKEKIKEVEFFPGGVAADEPLAAKVGRDLIMAGGTAADAAAGVYFALSVTLPSSASLGGGGSCVVWDYWSGKVEAIDFLSRPPAAPSATATRPSAVPGNVRGFASIHSKYGRLRWGQVVAPAEAMARFGIRVSRAFSVDLKSVEAALLPDRETRRIFAGKDGKGLVGEGDQLIQTDLADTLGAIRQFGPDGFYRGEPAAKLAGAFIAAGGTLSEDDLAGYRSQWRQTIEVPYGPLTLHFAPPPAAAGALEAQMWSMLTDGGAYKSATPKQRNHRFAEVSLRAFADRGRWLGDDGSSAVPPASLVSKERTTALMQSYSPKTHLPAASLNPAPVKRLENPAATSFVVIDGAGSAVACALTQNNLFGTGRVAPGTGVIPAALPGRAGRGPASLGPAIAVDHQYKDFYFAIAASGGVAAPTAIVGVMAKALIEKRKLADAIAAKRLHHGGEPDLLFYEQGFDKNAINDLSRRRHALAATKILGKVNAASCTSGLPFQPQTCSLESDPRGYGLSIVAEP